MLLADVYAIHSRHHLNHRQVRQGEYWAERGLALLRQRQTFLHTPRTGVVSYWFGNVLTQAACVSQNKRPTGLRAANRLLRDYLPLLLQSDPHYAWGQMTLANNLMELGRVDEAVTMGEAACKKGIEVGASEGFQRRRDFARLLLTANQPIRALDILTQSEMLMRWGKSLPDTAARHRLLEAECFIALGDKQTASQPLHMAEKIISEQGLRHLHTDLRRVAAPL